MEPCRSRGTDSGADFDRDRLRLRGCGAIRGHMLDFADSQLPDDELLERTALEEPRAESAPRQDRERLAKAREFRFRGGFL